MFTETLRPAQSLTPRRGRFSECFSSCRYLVSRPECFRLERQFAERGSSPRRECTPSQGAHNNATERGIRGPVVGRKNHYGSKSRRGTEVAAVFYTLLETAKLAGVDPAQYLREAALADARNETMLPADIPR